MSKSDDTTLRPADGGDNGQEHIHDMELLIRDSVFLSDAWKDALVKLFQLLWSRLVFSARAHGLTEEEAKDAVMHAWEQVLNGKWNPEKGSFVGWLYRVVHNYCLDILKKKRGFTALDFSAKDLVDLQSLASKLNQPRRAVDTWLAAQLSSDTHTALAVYLGQSSSLEKLQNALLRDINKIIGGALIYEKQRFGGIDLRPETKSLLSQNPQEDDPMRLNRLLIEDAYHRNWRSTRRH